MIECPKWYQEHLQKVKVLKAMKDAEIALLANKFDAAIDRVELEKYVHREQCNHSEHAVYRREQTHYHGSEQDSYYCGGCLKLLDPLNLNQTQAVSITAKELNLLFGRA